MKHGFFITASDTNVGKTWCAAAILRGLRRQGVATGVYKPIASGVNDALTSDRTMLADAAEIRSAERDKVCSYEFWEALPPTVAAANARVELEIQKIDEDWQYWKERYPYCVVEGAGGILSPVLKHFSNADLARRWSLPLIVVVPNRIGCINQAMMCLEVAKARSLEVSCVILNRITEDETDISITSNSQLLRDSLSTSDFAAVRLLIVDYGQTVIEMGRCITPMR